MVVIAVVQPATAIPVAREWRVNGREAKKEVSSMADSEKSQSLSGLSDREAREFHALFVTSFIVFLVIAIVAHFLVWQWRPWFPGPGGYAAGSVIEEATRMASFIQYAFIA